jgi:hypothetical protein
MGEGVLTALISLLIGTGGVVNAVMNLLCSLKCLDILY